MLLNDPRSPALVRWTEEEDRVLRHRLGTDAAQLTGEDRCADTQVNEKAGGPRGQWWVGMNKHVAFNHDCYDNELTPCTQSECTRCRAPSMETCLHRQHHAHVPMHCYKTHLNSRGYTYQFPEGCEQGHVPGIEPSTQPSVKPWTLMSVKCTTIVCL